MIRKKTCHCPECSNDLRVSEKIRSPLEDASTDPTEHWCKFLPRKEVKSREIQDPPYDPDLSSQRFQSLWDVKDSVGRQTFEPDEQDHSVCVTSCEGFGKLCSWVYKTVCVDLTGD
jgi:hypothetical protein